VSVCHPAVTDLSLSATYNIEDFPDAAGEKHGGKFWSGWKDSNLRLELGSARSTIELHPHPGLGTRR
jgi:hypothetical protein